MKRMLVIFSILLGIAAIVGVGAPVLFLAYGLTRPGPLSGLHGKGDVAERSSHL